MSDSGNYCRERCKEFEDVPPEFSADIEVKWERCVECGGMRSKRGEK